MTCQEVQTSLSLYLYGELAFAQEETLEAHLDECAFCQQALGREKGWHATLKSEQVDPPHELLACCRIDLGSILRTQNPAGARATEKRSWVDRLELSWIAQAATVAFLIVGGFGAGRWTSFKATDAGMVASAAPTVRVREVQSTGNDQVRLVVEQASEAQVQGSLQDPKIRGLLLSGATDRYDPAIRVASVEALGRVSGSDVMATLTGLARQDPNAAVRLRAVQGLRQHTSDREARDTLRWVLERDDNLAVRTEALDLLVPPGPVQLTPELLDTIQTVAHSPSDDYVHFRCTQVIRSISTPQDSF